MRRTNYLVILLLIILSAAPTLAQSPGGVSTGATLWYRADKGTNCDTNGCTINDWEEQLPTNADASQPTAALQPKFFAPTPELNFNPAIEYSGSQRLAIENLNYTNQNLTHVYVWAVFRTTINTGSFTANWSFLDFDRSEFFNLYAAPDNGAIGWSFEADGIKDNDGTSTVNDGILHIASGGYDSSLLNDTTIRVDGDNELSTNRTATDLELGDTTTRFGFIGDGSEATAFNGTANNIGFIGEIAEVISYTNRQLNLTQIQQIESYLALKYGITLRTNDGGGNGDYYNSTGTSVWDASSDSGAFHNEVFGIARDNGSDFHQRQSKSILATTGLSVYAGIGYNGILPTANSANTNDLSDGQFLIFGHNNDCLLYTSPSPRD